VPVCRTASAGIVLLIAIATWPAKARAGSEVRVTVDPRLALLDVVQFLASDERPGSRDPDGYRARVRSAFGRYRTHPTVRAWRELQRRGFGEEAIPALAAHLSDPPQLAVRFEFGDALVKRAGSRKRLADFVSALRTFARDTGFSAFYRREGRFRSEVVRRYAAGWDLPGAAGAVERYFGRPLGECTISVSLLREGNYVGRVSGSSRTVVLIMAGTRGEAGGYPTYGDAATKRRLAIHEMCHAYVNPAVEACGQQVSRYSALMKPIAPRMAASGYCDWTTILEEQIVRACVARLVRHLEGPSAGEALARSEYEQGYAYVPAIYRELETYERDRRAYPAFESFAPVLLEALPRLAAEAPPPRPKPVFAGPTEAAWNEHGSALVFVYPARTKPASAAAKLERQARRAAEIVAQHHGPRPVMSDEAALKMDWNAHGAVLYGTTRSNALLARWAARLPFRLGDGEITIAGITFKGPGVRLIAAVPNPENPSLPLLIYTGTEDEAVVGIHALRHGAEDFVVYRGDRKAASGRFGKDGARWWAP